MGKVLMSGIVPKLVTPAPPVTDITAEELAVGNTVYINENGVPIPYLVVHRGLPSSKYNSNCNGLWLLRKDAYTKRQWDNGNAGSYYNNSTIHTYLNGTFLALFDAAVQNIIKQATLQCLYTTVSAKIFLLAYPEVVNTGSSMSMYLNVNEGSILSYFSGLTASANNKRVAYYNGSATAWHLRTAPSSATEGGYRICNVNPDGAVYWNMYTSTTSLGIRPALILPFTAIFDAETMVLKGA